MLDYVKIHTNILRNPKVLKLSEIDQRRFIFWVVLNAVHDVRDLTEKSIAFHLGISERQWKRTFSTLQDARLVDDDGGVRSFVEYNDGVESNQGNLPAPMGRSVFKLKTKGGGEWRPMNSQVETWEKGFPMVDVPAELRKMALWLESNPTRRKTTLGMPRFIVSWLSRSNDAANQTAAKIRRSDVSFGDADL